MTFEELKAHALNRAVTEGVIVTNDAPWRTRFWAFPDGSMAIRIQAGSLERNSEQVVMRFDYERLGGPYCLAADFIDMELARLKNLRKLIV